MDYNQCLLNILKYNLDICKLRRRKNVTYFVYSRRHSTSATFKYTNHKYYDRGIIGSSLYNVIPDFLPYSTSIEQSDWDYIVAELIKYAGEKVKKRGKSRK